jgi:hypothetical protein
LLPRCARILKLGTFGSNWPPRTVTGFSLSPGFGRPDTPYARSTSGYRLATR